MGLSRKAMDEIESFSIEGGENTGICLLKQKTLPDVAHLLISVGGSGADMLREAKGLISQNCCSDSDKHLPPERVAYVAFDTDANERDKTSGRATGRVKLTEDELTIFSNANGVMVLLDPSCINYNRATYPWIYRWLDTKIPWTFGNRYGTGIRQVGRAMLFTYIKTVIDKLKKAIVKLITSTGVESLNIYVLSGVSGSTGSGMFLDMAYIVRQVAKEIIGAGAFGRINIRILGYILMPDVNLCNADALIRPVVLRNAGAALQELDHAMRLPEIGDYYECQYSDTMTIKTSKPPFDYVYLISARAHGGCFPENPYQRCLDTAADSILTFITLSNGNGPFRLHSYYSNIGSMQNIASAGRLYKERSSCYLSIGSSVWQIPADRLVKCVFTQMFRRMDNLFENVPTQDDVCTLFDHLGLSAGQIVEEFMGNVHRPFNPAQFNARELFGRNAIALDEYLPYEDCKRVINEAFTNIINDYQHRIRNLLQQTFTDPKRGPIWTYHAVVQGENPSIRTLFELIAEEKNLAIEYRSTAMLEADNLIADINRMRSTISPVFFANQRRCRGYIDAWNSYFIEIMKIHCCDLLIGVLPTLETLGDRYSCGLYDEALNTIANLNSQWLDVAGQVLEELERVVQRNTDEFRKAAVKDTGHGFRWPTEDLPNLDLVIDDLISRNGVDQTQLTANFLRRLLDKAEEWSQNVEVRKFIEEFLETEAQNVLNVSLEDILTLYWQRFVEEPSLSDSVKRELMPLMIRNAKPLFDGNTGMDHYDLIAIPEGCAQIRKGAVNYIQGRGDCAVETSYPRNRISVVCTTAGISLHDYLHFEECEKELSRHPNERGLYLHQGAEDFDGRINHMKTPLPSVIPARKRMAMNPGPERFAAIENGLIEEFREMRDGGYPFLKLEQTPDGQDYSLYLDISEKLNRSDYFDMIQEENYKNENGEIDVDKLRNLIEKLEEIRYGQGLPRKNDLPNRFAICENLLHFATQEMKDRYYGLRPVEEEKVKKEVAWEVAEWYYTSAYSFYTNAKEEKRKYDEVQKKLEELEEILEELEV